VSLGLYIHIPFCTAKCNYCHFVSMPFVPETGDRYRNAVLQEMQCLKSRRIEEKADSIYFGGGTPSLIPAEHICEILENLHRRLPISEDCEISLEANPDAISSEKIAAYRKAGIARISMGAQSFEERELNAIGRLHTPAMIPISLECLRKYGFENINLDMMLGLPFQTAESWRRNLEMMDRLSVPHISVYMLDLDEQCPLKSQIDQGILRIPEDDLISDLYLETIEFLSARGYLQYEISNFARPGYACRHNLKYWRREPVLGIGL
jgi:oxygen-independent coproporphyrinogen-3 oxidase